MRKLFLLVLSSLVLIGSFTFAYDLTSKDEIIIGKLTEKVESMIIERGETYRGKFVKILSKYSLLYRNSKPRYSAIFLGIADNLKNINTNCAKEGETANGIQCCNGLVGYDGPLVNGLSPQPDGIICYNPEKGYPICDYPERIKNGYQGPFYEAPYLIYPNGDAISTDPNILGTYQCDDSL